MGLNSRGAGEGEQSERGRVGQPSVVDWRWAERRRSTKVSGVFPDRPEVVPFSDYWSRRNRRLFRVARQTHQGTKAARYRLWDKQEQEVVSTSCVELDRPELRSCMRGPEGYERGCPPLHVATKEIDGVSAKGRKRWEQGSECECGR